MRNISIYNDQITVPPITNTATKILIHFNNFPNDNPSVDELKKSIEGMFATFVCLWSGTMKSVSEIESVTELSLDTANFPNANLR